MSLIKPKCVAPEVDPKDWTASGAAKVRFSDDELRS